MKKEVLISYTLIIFIGLFCLISGEHIVTTSNGGTDYSIDEDLIFTYNITINNSDLGQDANITQVNITIPTEFEFILNTEGTNAPYEIFSNTSIVLSWSNFTGYLINGSETKNFWFNANVTEAGDYTINITTLNSSGLFLSEIDIKIIACEEDWDCTWIPTTCPENETQIAVNCTDENSCGTQVDKPINRSCNYIAPYVECIQNWSCTNWSVCEDDIQTRICTDLNSCNNETEKPDENNICESEKCIEDWDCSKWSPIECTEDETQTRTCTDENSCGTYEEKPNETKSCIYEEPESNVIIIVIIIIILIMIIVIIVIIFLKKRKNNENTEESPPVTLSPGPPNMPPPMQRRFPIRRKPLLPKRVPQGL